MAGLSETGLLADVFSRTTYNTQQKACFYKFVSKYGGAEGFYEWVENIFVFLHLLNYLNIIFDYFNAFSLFETIDLHVRCEDPLGFFIFFFEAFCFYYSW